MPDKKNLQSFLKQARDRWKLADEADAEQQKREREDIAFEAGEQWPADIKRYRQGQQPLNGLPAVPARPTLVINKIKEPIRQILNQERAADLGAEIVPANDFADVGIVVDETEVKLREGLVRRIQRESKAADARTWAYKRAVIAGRGYYLVLTRYLPGKTWDQEVFIDRIYDQSAVLLDPAHDEPDGSDADWEFVGTWMPWDRYVATYPLAKGGDDMRSRSDETFMTLLEQYPDWYRDGSDTEGGKNKNKAGRAVRIVDYYYVEYEDRELSILADGTTAWADELPEDVEPVDTRTVLDRTIKWAKIGGGNRLLEETDLAGPDMPIVKVIGDEVLPYDGQRRAEGMVHPSKDSQMGENYMISKLVETIGLTPLSPLQVDPEAIDGYESWYMVANTRTVPYLPSRTYDDQGRQLKEPHRPAVDPNIFPMAQAINLFDQFIRSTTAVPDPTLGNVDPSLKSGKAIRELTGNAMQSTSNYLDNLARSIRYEAQIINNLLYPIYGARPGRLVRVLTGDNLPQTYQIDQAPAPPPAAMPGAPGQPMPMGQAPPRHPIAKLTKDAHFNVMIKVTKAFDSRRQEESTILGNLIGANPQLLSVFGDLFFINSDIPGRTALADRARAMLAPPIQQLLASQSQDPATLGAELAQARHQLQLMAQALQQMQQDAQGKQIDYKRTIDAEQIKQAGAVQRTALERDKDMALQRMRDATAIDVARINAETKGVVSAQSSTDEAIALAADIMNSERDRQHTAGQAEADRQHEATQAEQDRQHAMVQQAAAAAQQPPTGGTNGGGPV